MRSASNNGNHRGRTLDPIDALHNDIAALRRDFTALIGGRMGAVSERTREMVDHTRERADEAHQALSKRAGERPLTTILLAAAAGAVASRVAVWMLKR